MSALGRREWAILGALLVFSFIPTFGGLIRLVELGGGPAIIPPNPRALADPTPIALHILSSFLFCILGAVQVVPSLRRRHPSIHRVTGRIVAGAGCVSALSGLWMALFYAFPEGVQGAPLFWARVGLSLSMIGLILWAVIAIRSKNVATHRAAMLRAYAIGQGASTQAFWGMAWMVVAGSEPVGLPRDVMMISAWMINLAFAEWLITCARATRPLMV